MEKKYFWLAIFTISLLILFFALSYINQIFHCIPYTADGYWSNYGTYINGILSIILSTATVLFVIFNYLEQKAQNEKQSKFIKKQNFENDFNNQLNQYYKVIDSLQDTEHIHFCRDMQFVDIVRGYKDFNLDDGSFSVTIDSFQIFYGRYLYSQSQSMENFNNRCFVNFGSGRLFLKNLYLFMKGAQSVYEQHAENLSKVEKFKINIDNHLGLYRPILSNYFSTVFRILFIIKDSSNTEPINLDYLTQFLDSLSYYELPLIYYYAFYEKIKNNNEKYFAILKSDNTFKSILERIQPEDLFDKSDVDYYVIEQNLN